MTLRSPRARFLTDGSTVSQGRLVVMLYDRLLRDLDDANVAMRDKDIPGSHKALVHAQEIIAELDGALDHDRWPGAAGLADLYRYLLDRLVAANVSNDRRAVLECRLVLAPLRDTWAEAWEQTSTAPAPAGVAAAAAMSATGPRVSVGLDLAG